MPKPKKKPPLDPVLCHEALDRCAILRDIFEQSLTWHGGVCRDRKILAAAQKTEKAIDRLHDMLAKQDLKSGGYR